MSEEERIAVAEYHERTKHRFDAFAKGPDTIDWEAQPEAFRRFDGALLIQLPLAADTHTLPFSALFDKPVAPTPMNMDSIALLLEISLALSAWKQYGHTQWSLRCNPSSGNLHPTEAYIVTAGIDGLNDGLYHYRVDVHGLEQRCHTTAPPGNHSPSVLLGLSSVHWREAWKYGERAYRYCQLDAGHALAAVSYAAATLGWHISPHYEIGDNMLGQLLGVDRSADFTTAEREQPDLLVGIHPAGQPPNDISSLDSQRLKQDNWAGRANKLDPKHLYDWPVIEQVAKATMRPVNTGPDQASYDELPPPLPSGCSEPASRLIRYRRSAQAFDGITPMAQDDFYRLLDHLLPRPDIAPWDSQPWPARIHPILFVHRVEGLPTGLYALPRRKGAMEMLKNEMRQEFQWSTVHSAPEHLPLYQLIAGKAERTAARLSCQQAIAGDSAFSLAMLAEFEENITETPWRYRELYWEAGTVGQALYLEAEACGLRGTGIGCFFDDGVHELLGIQGQRLQSLYHFTIGAALTDQRIISLPPYHTQR